MLMCQIFEKYQQFDDRAHDENLILSIMLNGTRPPLLLNMPFDYSQMMQKCWDADPSKRPTILELWKFANDKLEKIYKNENLKNNTNKKNDDDLFRRLFKLSKNKKHNGDDIDGSNSNST